VFDLKGKTALVTGAAKRIGRAIALALAENGVNVALHYNESAQTALDLAEQLRSFGADAWTVQADLADRDEAGGLVKKSTALAGRIDLLINNASIFFKNRIDDFTGRDLDLHIQVNAFSPLLLSRSFAGQTQAGTIINLLDSNIRGSDAEHAAYHLSKKMLFAITGMLALELAPGVRVNGAAPGLVLPPPGEDLSYLERNKHTVPLARYGDVRDVAEAVLFLARADFITGQIIYVDGGRHLIGSNLR
jgi:pteridine reductase